MESRSEWVAELWGQEDVRREILQNVICLWALFTGEGKIDEVGERRFIDASISLKQYSIFLTLFRIFSKC